MTKYLFVRIAEPEAMRVRSIAQERQMTTAAVVRDLIRRGLSDYDQEQRLLAEIRRREAAFAQAQEPVESALAALDRFKRREAVAG